MGHSRIPNKLRKVRRMAGLSQKEVSLYLGHKSANRLCRWEKGVAVPNLENALKLGALYQTLIEDLYFDLYQKHREELKKFKSKRK